MIGRPLWHGWRGRGRDDGLDGPEGPARRGRAAGREGTAGAPAGAAARVAAARVRERPLLPRVLRQGRAAPRRLPLARRSGPVPVHDEGGSAGELPVRDVRRAAGPDPAHPRVERDDRAAHGRRLHGERPVHVGRHGGPFDPRGGRPARRQGPYRLRLRPVHRRTRRPLRRGTPRLYGDPRVRRYDGTSGPADPGPEARDHHGDTVVHADPARRVRAPGRGPARHLAAGRRVRGRAVDRGDAPRDRGAVRDRRRGHLRPLRGHRPRGRPGVRGDQGRSAHLGGPLLPGGRRPPHR